MHKLDDELDDILQHFGVKGMRWGVRNEEHPTGKRKSSKLDNHPAVSKFGKNPIKGYRKFQAKTDAFHIDPKTGEYTHQGKTAKTVRVMDKVWDIAAATVLITGAVVTSTTGI